MTTNMTGSDARSSLAEPTEQVWRDLLGRLQTFVRRRIADPNRAEDVVAEILLRIHQNVDSLDDAERLPNWVFRIARNAVIDEYRRAARGREQLVPTLADEPGAEPPDEDAPAALAELANCLRPLLTTLPAEQRRAIEMIDLGGTAQAQAAQQEGVSLSGMKSRVQRARRRLAELLGQCCALTLDARGLPIDYTPPPSCHCTSGPR
jgi:RNA polymerase sigma-70 factor, ECF subfamily